jgi:hypothetical protein
MAHARHAVEAPPSGKRSVVVLNSWDGSVLTSDEAWR